MQIATQAIKTTKDQRTTINTLKAVLGEKGYVISPVAEECRRTEWDFLAAERYWPRRFLLIRPTRKGQISIVGFYGPSHYVGTRKHLNLMRPRLPARVVWSKKQLHYESEEANWWKSYFPPDVLEPLGLSGL